MKYHVNKRYPCEATVKDTPIEQLVQEYNKPKLIRFECETCGKNYISKQGFEKHNCNKAIEGAPTIKINQSSSSIQVLQEMIIALQTRVNILESKKDTITIYLKSHSDEPTIQEQICTIRT
jgi:hypothetical protein